MSAVSHPQNEKFSCYKNNMRRKIDSQFKSVSVSSASVRFLTNTQDEHIHNEKDCLLTCYVVYSGRNLQAFRGRQMPPSSGNVRQQIPQKSWQNTTRLHGTSKGTAFLSPLTEPQIYTITDTYSNECAKSKLPSTCLERCE